MLNEVQWTLHQLRGDIMVYIDKRFPSQQSESTKTNGKFFSFLAMASLIVSVVFFILVCVGAKGQNVGSASEIIKILWNKFSMKIIITLATFLATFVLAFLSSKENQGLIAPRYINAANGLYFVAMVVWFLIYIF